MTIYYKFLKPTDEYFNNRQRRAFNVLFIPYLNHSDERYCYAEIPEALFAEFLEDFDSRGEILVDRTEFPDTFEAIAEGRNLKFRVARPKKSWG